MSNPSGSVPKAHFGPYEVDFRAGELLKNGRRVRLQDQPLQILTMLLEQPGGVVTREELRHRLWPTDTFVDFDHGLNNAVNRLREALNDSADAPRFIETLPRRGYRFIAEVNGHVSTESRATGLADSIEAGEIVSGVGSEETATAKYSSAPSLHRVGKFWLAAAGMSIAAALILSLYLGRERRFGTSASMRIQSIAVLPLENLSGDPSQEYLSDGITDGLTTSLAQMRGIRVISRTSAMRYKGTKKGLPEIARELNVDAVVEGSMSRSDGLMHVNAQLIHAADDRHLWAHSYSASTEKIANLQVEIAAGVAREIGTASSPEAVARFSTPHSVNTEAYDLYLRAETYHGVETREANDEALRLLERSIVIDPNFAAAYAELAFAYRVRGFSVEPETPEEWMGKAKVAVQRALSLDPNLPEAYLSRGHLLWSPTNNWAHERAVADYRRALSLNPSLAEAHHQIANVYNHVGLLDKAESEIARAVELDPLNVGARFRVGINLLYQGKYEDSLTAIRDSEQFNPSVWTFQTSFALQHLRRLNEAQKRVDSLLIERPEDRGGTSTAMQALLAAEVGDTRKAEAKVREALAKGRGFQHFHHIAYAVASAYALLNRPEPALRYLQMAADDGFPCYPLFEHDSNLENLRKNPQFISFMREQEKQWEYFRAHM
jgi:TolB-like protein/DNA-binding winged helix-turn-helix (wHTH) protein/tetratricopeptide (TPR) repeat protein